jgi:hypothetical protein
MAVNFMNGGVSFFDRLVHDRGPHSYYLVIHVDSPNYKGKAIIENDGLLLFLYQTQGIRQEKYPSFAKNLLINKSWLKTKNRTLQRWGFRKITKIKSVDDVAAKGKEEFLRYYFAGKAGRVLEEETSDDQRNAIIEKLFEWQIATSHDDLTGRLFYTEFEDLGDSNSSSDFIRNTHN